MITLRNYQQEVVYAILNFFQKGGKGNPLVQAPTGAGKSIIISGFCKQVIEKWPDQKILIVSHIKEILEQNYNILKKHLQIDIGLYSAGLNSKTLSNITVAGIQSIYNKPELFDQFNIIICDECHLIPHKKNGIYHKFFNQVRKRVIGFTATPFRLGSGYLHKGEGSFFSKIIYDIPIKKLQDEGFLCKLTAKGTKKRLDPEGIKKQAGDYILKELSLAFDREAITADIISELLIYKQLRKKWLLFAIDIEHSENITKELNDAGVKTACVHSKMNSDRDKIINEFKDGTYQALVSVAVLTTGFDCPSVDLIALLRPTSSPVLHVQIIGRGLRVAEGKNDCLILDFAGNLRRLGPIDDPLIKIKGDGKGEAIMKECNNCWEIVHAAVRICPCCKQKFQFKHKLSSKTIEREVISLEEWHHVDDVKYYNYKGKKKIPMLKVTYFCGLRRFNEYVLIEHTGYPLLKAKQWWSRRSNYESPETVQKAVELSKTLRTPESILVHESGKYPEIKEQKLK